MADEAQSYRSHRRYVPGFHFLTAGLLILNLLWSVFRLYRAVRWQHPRFDVVDDSIALLLAVALLLLFYYVRTFPLRVQDRVIRLEVQRRMERLLPPDLVPRIGELTVGQFIALRFAGDEELPGLTRKVLDERIRSREAIKRLVRTWRADHLRA
jgi:Family of unknown function (DUF6526)